MAGMLVNAGEVRMLRLLCNTSTSLDNLYLRLYQNDTTPLEADTSGTYTEATFTGYAVIPYVGTSDWTLSSASTVSSSATGAQATYTLTATTSQSIYGYYFTSGATGWVPMAAERFAAGPFVVQSSGDQIKVTPTITQD